VLLLLLLGLWLVLWPSGLVLEYKDDRGRVVPFFASFTESRKNKRFLDKLKALWK
jgi:hypothetical protein